MLLSKALLCTTQRIKYLYLVQSETALEREPGTKCKGFVLFLLILDLVSKRLLFNVARLLVTTT